LVKLKDNCCRKKGRESVLCSVSSGTRKPTKISSKHTRIENSNNDSVLVADRTNEDASEHVWGTRSLWSTPVSYLSGGLVRDGPVEGDLEPWEELRVCDGGSHLGVCGDFDVRGVPAGRLVSRLDVSIELVVLLHTTDGEVDASVSLGGRGNLLVQLEAAAEEVLGCLSERSERKCLRHRFFRLFLKVSFREAYAPFRPHKTKHHDP